MAENGGMTLRALAALVLTFLSLAAQQWQKAPAESVGFSTQRLEALTPFLKTLDTTSMMVISHGKVVYEYGDVSKISYLASCRKSILAMLYGNYVASGQIVLSKTLRDLKFDDVGGLLPRELGATVENLITARSGVYHPPSYSGDAQDSAPPRGSQKPGTYYLYNNWDFNAAGAAFEKMTGKDIYDALQSDLAIPLGMEDFNRALQKKEGDAKKSVIPAYPIHLSTRDMARVGQLMLREGNWNGKQVIPRDWAKHIVTLVTPVYDMNPPSWKEYAQGSLWGYGYMWWVWDDQRREGPFAGAYTARGAIGQYITVLPALDLVVAHKTVPAERGERTRNVSGMEYQAILMHIVTAHCGQRCGQ